MLDENNQSIADSESKVVVLLVGEDVVERDNSDVFDRRGRILGMKSPIKFERVLRTPEQIGKDVRLGLAIQRRSSGRFQLVMQLTIV